MSAKKTAILITIITLLCKLFGFGRELVLAYFFGTSYTVDAYLMAINIPDIFFGWLTAAAISFTPLYMEQKLNNKTMSNKFTSNIISILFLISLVCALFGSVFSKQIINITAPGFEGKTLYLTQQYLNISIWNVILIGIIQLYVSYLNCNDLFISSNITNLVLSVTQILFIIVAGVINSKFLIYGVLISRILQLLFLYLFAYKTGYKFSFSLKITPEVKRAFILVIPIFISSMIIQINNFIDKSFASSLVEGSIAALNYGAILRGFIFTIFSIAITTMIYPMLSKAFAEKNIKAVKTIFSKALNIIIILFVPITIGAIILGKPAIDFVFQRGEFDSASSAMTSSAFIMYSLSLIALALRDVITKVFYSMQDTKSTLYIGAFAVAINIIFNIILVKPLAHTGLALSTSLSAIISLPLFFIFLRKKIGSLGLKNSAVLFLKSSISTIIMGGIVYFGYDFINSILGQGKVSVLLSIIISAGVGGIIYFILMIVMKVKEMDFFTDILRKIIFKFKHF